MSEVWAVVWHALLVHGSILIGAGAGLALCALVIAATARERDARPAAATLFAAGAVQVAGGGTLWWYSPLAHAADPAASSAEHLDRLRAAFEQAGTSALALAAVALSIAGACAFTGWRGVRFGLGVGAAAIAVQAFGVEAVVHHKLVFLAHERALRDVEARVAAYYARGHAGSFEAEAQDDAPLDIDVERLLVRDPGVMDAFPALCLASATEIWCQEYGSPSTAALEKLVRQPGFGDAIARASAADVAAWVAFALGTDVWLPERAAPYTAGHAAPPQVSRTPGATRVDFWERPPEAPGFGVRLRHTVVALRRSGVAVDRGPLGNTLRPAWDRRDGISPP